ncbi:hypothetical protein EXIGLDRAFT_359703 [Exidia glandulosa HHB12029]|uniref:Uncharacterized protein n=1 Tax=Exidia glandulosa HHB12029 TaxID=1314781 RepID=A0A165C7E0_EXIGL|nr:hypothetical protein EXIGLDRAFT_359703 [Exidia glandulosa HHB12029]
MPQTDAPPSSSVSFPTQDTPPPRSPAKDAAYRAPSTGIPKLGSRSTSFAIVQDSSPHRSSVPSPLGPGGGSRRRVVTQTPTSSTRKGKERENNYAGEIFGGFGLGGVGEDLYLGPDDSEVAEDVQRLLTRRENRQRTKDSLTSSTTTSSTSTVRSPATPPPPTLPPGRPTPTKAQTSPATVPRSAPTTPSKPPRVPATSLPSLRPTTSTEALVIYDNPTASSSKTTLDWSGYLPQEQSPKKHKRTFSLTRKRKVSKTELQTSDTGGEDADTFEGTCAVISFACAVPDACAHCIVSILKGHPRPHFRKHLAQSRGGKAGAVGTLWDFLPFPERVQPRVQPCRGRAVARASQYSRIFDECPRRPHLHRVPPFLCSRRVRSCYSAVLGQRSQDAISYHFPRHQRVVRGGGQAACCV